MNKLLSELLKNKDEKYAEFNKKIIPDTKYKIIGVRIPALREMAKNTDEKTAIEFLYLPHTYYEEYMLHGFLIAKIKDKVTAYSYIENFLPLIDNWAICDSFSSSLKFIAKYKSDLFKRIKVWIKSDKVYTVRFAVVMLLWYFITPEYIDFALDIVKSIKSDEYYINMAIAWFYSVAIIKQIDKTLPILQSKTLPAFVQNKAISKCCDSFRIDNNTKEYLKTLKF